MAEPDGAGHHEPSHGLSRYGARILEVILETIPDIVLLKDAVELRYVLLNRAAEAFLGVPRQRLLWKTDHDIYPLDQADAFVARDREILALGLPVDRQRETVRCPAGVERVHQTTRFPIVDEKGRPRYLLEISADVTDRDAAHDRDALSRELIAAQKMESVGLLAGGVAHDFNNLLTVILGAGKLLLDTVGDDRPERRDVEDVVAAAQRGGELTRQLLAFGRTQAPHARALDLNVLVSNAERLFRRLLGEDVALRTALAGDAWLVHADPGQLEQVIANLVVNARDAMPAGGTVTIGTANAVLDEAFALAHPGAQPGHHVVLSVTDTGTGITDAVRARLFEPFFTTKPPGRGTGLGLPSVQRIVRDNDGIILVESQPGRGSTFRVYFPRALGVDSAPHDLPAPAASRRGTETVLVVEDDAAVRELAVRVLHRHGYTVLAAPGADAASSAAAAHEGEVHLLVTDVMMSGRTGPSLAAELAAARPGIGILYISGHSDDVLSPRGVLAPGVTLLRKPFTPADLVREVRRLLDSRT